MSSEPVLRLGLIGVGVGASQLLPAMTSSPHYKLTAVADVRPDALERFAQEYGTETHLTVESICASPNVDVVWIATPNHLHAPHVIAAANAGKHVIVSKPIAITLDECAAMNEACERNGVKFLAGHTQSMAPTIRKMAELARSGQYGELGMIQCWNFTEWIYRPRLPDELDSAKGGGPVFRQASHQVDIVRLIGGGLVRSVRAMTKLLDPSRPVPGAYTAYLEFEDGTPATVIYSGYGHFDAADLSAGVGAVGERRGTPAIPASTTPLTPEEEAKVKESMRYNSASGSDAARARSLGMFGMTLVTCATADLTESPFGVIVHARDGKTEVPAGSELRGEAELEEMYQGVVNHQPLSHDGRWGEATLEVCLAIAESARERKEIRLSRQVASPE
ncbi:MAG: Gfo/Idh/MocA family protein [Chloroflexota bacterium]